ncbi:MAG: potassium channel family protein [Acidobacteria bacterium]|nr:potassium channel family protein [Acidobacteriota bacterium]
MPRILVVGQSHLAARLGQLARRLGVKAALWTGGEPAAETLQSWKGLQVHPPGLDIAELLEAPEALEADAALFCDVRDEQNLSRALAFRDACPKLRLVIALADPELGRKVARELENCAVLSSPELSAPCFAAAALRRGFPFALDFGGEAYALGAAPEDESQGVPGLRPLRDLVASGPRAPEEPGLQGGLARLTGGVDRYLLLLLVLIFVTLAGATAYFHFTQGLHWIQALYFVVTTFCTVGYGDYSLRDAPDSAKLVGVLLMLTSVTLTACLFAIVTNILVQKRGDALEGRRRFHLRNHVVVCGLGTLGAAVATRLRDLGVPVIVIERDPANPLLQELSFRRIPYMVSDATHARALWDANAGRARALVCAINDDLTALEIGLAAKALRPALHVVLRIFDGGFADRIERHFHIHTALSASALAAPAFLAHSLDSRALTLLEDAGGWQVLAERGLQEEPFPGERPLAMGSRVLAMVPMARLWPWA